MKTIGTWCLLAVLIIGSAVSAETVFQGFGQWGPLAEKYRANAAGQLPEGWNDNSEWARVRLVYSGEKDGQGEYLRLAVKAIEQGNPQLVYAGRIPALARDRQFQLSFRIRNRTAQPVKVGLRDQGKPYAFHWETSVAPGPAWQTCRYRFRPSASELPQRLMWRVFAVGEVDLASPCLETVPYDANLLHSTDFSGGWRKIGGGDGLVTGELPAGWNDDSSWGKSRVDYSHRSFQSDEFLRVDTKDVGSGRQQLALTELPDAPGDGAIYRLRFRARSGNGVTLQYGLRQRGPDYSFYWQKSVTLTGDWQTVEQTIMLPRKNARPMGFWFISAVPGVYDLADFSLRLVPVAEMRREIARRYPDGGPANLCRNSVFPLGMPFGWSLDRELSDGDDVRVETVRCDGLPLPALKIASSRRILLTSAPFFTVIPDRPHVVRLRVRGEGRWHFSLRCAGQTIAAKDESLSPGKWQEVTIPFTSSLQSDRIQLRLEGDGELTLYGLVAGPAEKTGPVDFGTRPESALALPPSEVSAAGVQFEDEPARVAYAVVAAPAGAVLAGTVTDIYGEKRPLPPVRLSGSVVRGDLNYASAPSRLGAFRVETWVEKDGKVLSPVSELVVTRLRRPRGWGRDLPDSPFGVHTNSTRRHLLMAKAAGFNWVRLHDAGLQYIGWWKLEPQKGKWTFFDRELQRYRTNHLEILGEFGTAPSWASYQSRTVRKDKSGYFDKFFQPLDLADYGHYVATVAARYRSTIAAWDVWNEPWIHAWWAVDYDRTRNDRSGYLTSREPGRDFVQLMETAYRNAKKVDPGATVLGINTTDHAQGGAHNFSGTEWTRQVVAAGGLQWCDVLCYHSYVRGAIGFPDDMVGKGFRAAFAPLLSRSPTLPKPVWMTEGSGVTMMIHNGLSLHTSREQGTENLELIADRCCRYMLSLLGNGVAKFFIYSMHSHNGEFQPYPAQWRFLTTDDGSLHPSAAAVSNFAWQVEGLKFERVIDLKDGLYAYLFSNGARSTAVISSSLRFGGSVHWPRLPQGIAAADLYGNPLPSPATFTGRLIYFTGEVPAAAMAAAVSSR